MHPWGITTKPCIGSKERTKNDLIRAFYCALDSIPSARTRGLRTLCAALACPNEICVSGITKAFALTVIPGQQLKKGKIRCSHDEGFLPPQPALWLRHVFTRRARARF